MRGQVTRRNLVLLAIGLLFILLPWLLSRGGVTGGAAAVTAAQTGPGGDAPSMSGLMAKALGSLLVVLALLLGAAWFARRYGMATSLGGAGGSKRLRVEEQVGLAGRQTLYLVRCGSRRFLVGSGQQGVRLVARLGRERNSVPETPSEVVS